MCIPEWRETDRKGTSSKDRTGSPVFSNRSLSEIPSYPPRPPLPTPYYDNSKTGVLEPSGTLRTIYCSKIVEDSDGQMDRGVCIFVS